MGQSWDILSSSGAKSLPTFLMSGILNGGPKVYQLHVVTAAVPRPAPAEQLRVHRARFLFPARIHGGLEYSKAMIVPQVR